MLKSMTGFGRGELACPGREYVVEIKTINHRYLDLNFRLPRQFTFLEEFARKTISKAISRGKVEVNIQITSFGDTSKNIGFDEELIEIYLNEAKLLQEKLNLKDDLTFSRAIQLPDVVKVKSTSDEETILKEFETVLNSALDNLKHMRQNEGSSLADDISHKCDNLANIFKIIEDKSGDVVKEYKIKLTTRLEELLEDATVIDEARIAQEVAIFADKSCIDEEIVRFKSHIVQLLNTLKLDEPVGKKLDFIVQEMNREVNTIGSKANDLDITRAVIELKNEIEKIREQIQNIE